MKQIILCLALLLIAQVSFAQGGLELRIKDEATKEPVAGATVSIKGTAIVATSDAQGVALLTGNQILPLTPKSKLNSALLFEREEDFKAGIEAYYTGSQYLTNRFRTRACWVLGIFCEKSFGKFSLFINAENITDTRQGRFGPVVFPPHQNPTFSEIYTHTEGRVFNGGIKVRL